MGIFNNPDELAKLLASVNNTSSQRPLTPIKVAEYLEKASDELGSDDELMKRVGIKKSMRSAFKNLLNLPEDIKETVCWGKPNPETFEIGFSVAHYIAEGLSTSEQKILINTIWDEERPYSTDEIKRIKSHYKSNNGISMESAIKHILKIDRPTKEIIYVLISKLSKESYVNLKNKSKELNISPDLLANKVLSKFFSKEALTSVKIYPTATKVVFTGAGEKKLFECIKNLKMNKKNIIEQILQCEGST